MIAGSPHPTEAHALVDHLLSSATERELVQVGGC